MIATEIADVFECPKCGHHQVEELLVNVTQTSQVLSMFEKQNRLHYGAVTAEDGEFAAFQCTNCGWKLPVVDSGSLCEYLQKTDRECKPGCYKEPANESSA